jgi:hypothetical protein
MEQRVLIKYLREAGHGSTQIHFELVEHYGDKAFSCSDFSYSLLEFFIERESVENSKCSKRLSDFQTHFRIEGVLEVSFNASVPDIAQTTRIALSTVFYVLTQVLHLKFHNWR